MSGKRNEFEDLLIVYVESAGHLRMNKREHDPSGLSWLPPNAQFPLDTTQNKILY
jgi:hypothetical protein